MKKSFINKIFLSTKGKAFVATSVLSIAIAGCSLPKHAADIQTEIPHEDALNKETNFSKSIIDSVIVLDAGTDRILEATYNKGDALPSNLVGPTYIENISVKDALKVVAGELSIPILISSDLEDVKISFSDPVKRPVGEVVDIIATQAGLFYVYEDGILKLTRNRKFVVRVPNLMTKLISTSGTATETEGGSDTDFIDPSTSTLVDFEDAIKDLGAKDVSSSPVTSLITFEADHTIYKNVAKYLSEFEDGQDNIVYDAWIYEVVLGEDQATGIKWNNLSYNGSKNISEAAFSTIANGASTAATTLGGGGVSLVLEAGNFALDAVFSFLESQGETQILSKPTLAVVSGNGAKIHVGEKIKYISEITRDTDDDDNSGGSDDNDITTETEELDLGLTFLLSGSNTNDVISTNLSLQVVELVEFVNFTSGDDV